MRARRVLWLVLVLALLGAVTALLRLGERGARGAPIRAAYAGPTSGPSAEDGLSAVRAVELVFDRVHRRGGILGRPLVLDVYDDANDAGQARANAREIAAQGDTVAVIGHNFSTCSIAAGEVYEDSGIAAITNAATNEKVTAENAWYFRTVFNDRVQGRYLVAYAGQVLGLRRLAIIYEIDAYGAFLAEVMAEKAAEDGIDVAGVFGFEPADPDLARRLARIAAEVTGPGAPSGLLLAMQPVAGIELVKQLRDRGYEGALIAADALASQAFADGFLVYPEERARRGFYSDGIYASTPFLFDAGGRRAGEFLVEYVARYDRSPDWYAAMAADAAHALVEALRRGELSPAPATIAKDRAALRDALASIDDVDPVQGVTGPTWFDEIGDAEKPVAMGRFVGGEVISAFVQLQLLPGVRRLEDLPPTLDPKRVVTLDDDLLYRTDVARAGVRARRFANLDFDAGTFDLDFDIWFRHSGDRGVEDVVFTNAVTPIDLGAPVDEVADGPLQYRLYHASGSFRADTVDADYSEHALALDFRHEDRTREDLIFAVDSVGMDLGRARTRAERSARARALLGANTDWTVRDLFFFESEIDEPALGHPGYLEAARRFSQLTIGVGVRRLVLSLRGSVSERYQMGLLVAGLAGSVGLLFAGRGIPKLRWLLQSALALLLLVVAESVLGNWLKAHAGARETAYLSRAFDVLWWAVPALLADVAVYRFVWRAMEERSGRAVPTLLRYMVSSLIYMLAFFGVVAFVYDYRLTGLLATSGVLAMILGLAVQLNITNIFAGVALSVERPFRVGDWIMIHGRTPFPEDGVIGQVVDVNWRTTRLRTADETEVVIPNGVISEKTITNFMAPGERSRFEILFSVDQSFPPEEVLEVIRRAVDGVTGQERGPLPEPKPSVRINRTTENGIEYAVRYRIVPRDVSPPKARHTINEAVIRELRAAGMELAYPRRRIREDPSPESS